MKGIKKIHLTAIAFAVAQFACASAYAQQTPNTTLPIQCLPGDGNSFLSPSPQTSVNTEAQKQQLAVAYVKEFQKLFSLTSTQAAGMVANLLWESGLNSGMKNVTGSVGEAVKQGDAVDRTGFGVAQWIMERKFKLIELAGGMKIPTSSQCANFNHLGNELIFEPTFAKVIPAVRAQKDLVGAVCAFEKLYQIPKDPNSQNRIQLARNIMSWLGESYVEGNGSTGGDACDFYPSSQSGGSGSSTGSQTGGTGSTTGSQFGESFVSNGGGAASSGDYQKPPHGFANDWTTVRVSNTTGEPLEARIEMGAGQGFPPGVDGRGKFSIAPGQYVDIHFAPGTNPNLRSTKGGERVFNLAELNFDVKTHFIWYDVSYINGANSNVRMFCSDGVHSGYLGNVIAGAPPAAKIEDWGVMAPYDRFHHSDDLNNPNSARGGPNGLKNAGAAYLYSILKKGEGYVDRGKPIQVDTYDDASSLACTGKIAVVF